MKPAAQSPWPVPVIALTPAACGAVLWRMSGAPRLTVIVKATFALRHGASAELSAPREIVRADRPQDGWSSLEEASEAAPYLPSAGVIARGHACAPGGHAATAVRVRLALYQHDRWILNKVLHVFGDRTRSAPNPSPFQRMPIVYERAYGARHFDGNPAGVGGGEALPNIVDPADSARPAGFGAIAPQWAPRRYFLTRGAEGSAGGEELDSHFDFRYFNAAPPDQQVEFLRGYESVFLENLHPQFPWITSTLPGARGVARVQRDQGREQAVELVADTLSIDADQLICSVIWRGNIALQPGDAPARMRVLAGVEMPGHPIVWPAPEALASSRGAVAPEDPETEGLSAPTAEIRAGASAAAMSKPIAPFALPQPGTTPAPSDKGIPGAPWSAEPVIRSPLPLDIVLDGSTITIPSAQDRLTTTAPGAAFMLPILPFIPAEPPPRRQEEPSPASMASGLPFSVREGASPPPEVPAPVPASHWWGEPPSRPFNVPGPPPGGAFSDNAPLNTPMPAMVPGPALPEADPGDAETPKAPAAAEPTGKVAAVLAAPEPIGEAPPVSDVSPETAGAALRAKVLAWLKSGEPLYNLDFAGGALEGIDWSGAALERRSFAGASLARCNFTKVSLAGADMSGADLTDAILREADLTGANLSRATLAGAQLHGATLTKADLSFAKGSGASFEGATLRGADLRRSRLTEAVFDGADASGISGNKADFSASSFVKANLQEANLRDAKLKKASLAGANVDRADLRDADLGGANVYGVNLAAAKTNGAILRDLVESPPPEGSAGSTTDT